MGLATAATAACSGLVACQDGTRFLVDNRCGIAIEVDMNDVADPVALGYKLHWKMIPREARAAVRDAPDPLRRLYVWVRAAGSTAEPDPFVFEPSALRVADDEVVAVIIDGLCPVQ